MSVKERILRSAEIELSEEISDYQSIGDTAMECS